jgi:DNA-binding NarL/FixJ family response regulator
MSSISFVIACESYIVNSGLEKIISRFPGAEAVQYIFDKKQLIPAVNKVNPDFLIVNARMLDDPHKNIAELFKRKLKSRFIILTGEKRRNEKFVFFDEHICLSDKKDLIINKLSDMIDALPEEKKQKSELTEREKDVLRQVALGYTNKEIAEKLFISIHTVITHRKNITKKTDIRTASGMTAYAILQKIIHPEEIDLQ